MPDRSGRRPDKAGSQREILRVTVGSRAYGTANAKSDLDERAVFMVNTRDFFKVDSQGNTKIPRTLWVEDPKQDLTGWEMEPFIKLALQCNPTALELLWVPGYSCTWEGQQLRDMREAFLSRQKVYDAFVGYAKNQRTKMFEQPTVGWTRRNWKFAEAYVRVLYQGFILLKDGRIPVDLAEEEPTLRDYLLDVKEGKVRAGNIVDLARATEDRMLSALNKSKIPDQADVTRINQTVADMRHRGW